MEVEVGIVVSGSFSDSRAQWKYSHRRSGSTLTATVEVSGLSK
jgi:hypothetical protein